MNRLIVRSGLVTLRDLAEALGMDRSVLHRHLKKLGIPRDKIPSHEARGSLVSVITKADAERYIQHRKDRYLEGNGEVEAIEI